jgi:hypothetical protein
VHLAAGGSGPEVLVPLPARCVGSAAAYRWRVARVAHDTQATQAQVHVSVVTQLQSDPSLGPLWGVIPGTDAVLVSIFIRVGPQPI